MSAVLIDKIKGRPAWNPAALKDVDDTEVLAKFFSKYSPERGTAPSITLPEHLNLQPSNTGSPMRYALPMEDEIKQLVVGNHKTSGGTTITQAELIQHLETLRRGKMGIREKVNEVVARRCVEHVDKESGAKWLKWQS